ncbi:MAG: hypothetical protein Kow0098_06290 [Ignavibacteriaceae bacterium]
MIKKIIILSGLFTYLIFGQTHTITGTVRDAETNQPLSFANIRVSRTTNGTAANLTGQYELKLNAGEYSLVASYIGYNSDTVRVSLDKNRTVDFSLRQADIKLPEIVVRPGENPALEIIRKAILKKHQRDSILSSYTFEAYTKGLIRTTGDITATSSAIGIGVGEDSSELKISGILENKSKGYFLKPDYYKELIVARKQTANFPSSINILTGGRFIQNFYQDDVRFFGSEIPGPVSDNATSYYFFFIKDRLVSDDKTIFEIYLEPDDPTDPGFTGSVFITDSTFDLVKVDLQLNRAANTGGIFDTVNVFQQFSLIDSVYMPVDYRLFVKADYLGIARFGFELNTILYNYSINPALTEDIFGMAVLTVLPDADEKDPLYWKQIQAIPSTSEELKAYRRIDSLEQRDLSFWDKFSILSTNYPIDDHFSVSAPLGMYHFNRIEGHAPDFSLQADKLFNKRLDTELQLSYGFADEKLKEILRLKYLFGNYRTYSISLEAFNKISVLFEESESYNELTSTLLSLVSKYEFRDYFYTEGFGIKAQGEVFPVLSLKTGFRNSTDKNAFLNVRTSLFYDNKTYRDNTVINEVKLNTLSFGFGLDFRNYIEDGYYRRRTGFGQSYILLNGEIILSDKEFLNSSVNFKSFVIDINSSLKLSSKVNFDVTFFGLYTTGTLPYQYLYSLPGNIDLTSASGTFRTLNVNEVKGEKVATVFFEQNWTDWLFRSLNVPLLKNMELQLSTFISFAYSEIGEKTERFIPVPVKQFNSPFYEAGFGIGHVLIPLRVEFTWKLNHRGENNFRVGINTFVF